MINLFKPFTALVSVLAFAAPAVARVDLGTTPLLQSLPQYGVTLALNSSECDGRYHGSYHTGTRVLTVCYSGRPAAEDHDTVRHEAFHALQHCVTEMRGQQGLQPILRGQQLNEFVTGTLTEDRIVQIKSSYPKSHWLTELEAFAAAELYTADQISGLLNQWCRR